jgi:FixJ family two-component response regulator
MLPVEKRKIVAVVDDQPSVLSALKRLLNASGFAAEVFSSAEEFLGNCVPDEMSCVVLDIHLGGMSGIELRRRLSEIGEDVPVIFMTALNDEVVRRAAIEAGCVALLGKPFAADALIDAVHKAIH